VEVLIYQNFPGQITVLKLLEVPEKFMVKMVKLELLRKGIRFFFLKTVINNPHNTYRSDDG
jgi:hypothetical protein